MSPGNVLPVALDTSYGVSYARWYLTNGAEGKRPHEEDMVRALDLLRAAPSLPRAERTKSAQEIWRLAVDNQWAIGLVGQAGAVMGIMVAKNDLGNTPSAYANINLTWPPSIARPVQFYWKK